jgi:hypothetical protein
MGLYAFRLPDDLMSRVDAYAKRLEAEQPGISVTRADAVRALLTRALDATGDKTRKVGR